MNYLSILQDSIDYIEEHLTDRLTAAELADRAGFSLYHYYRLFQSATGMPVMQYILRRRLLHAIYRIRGGCSKTDAAFGFGFDTYAGFYKAFRREFGCTPSAFLQQCRASRPCRLHLTKEEHMRLTKRTVSRVLRRWNLENEAVTDIYYEGTGKRNRGAYYVGDTWVLKFSPNLGKIKTHAMVSKALASAGLYAATPVATTDGEEFVADRELYFCLTQRLPGSQTNARKLLDEDPVSGGRFIGEIIGQLHLALSGLELTVNDEDLLRSVTDWALPKSQAVLGLSGEKAAAYLDKLTALRGKLPRQIIHRDPNPGNIIRWEDKWGFIDFELSQRNVRLYDPCYAATAILSETWDDPEQWLTLWHSILRGYDSVVNLTPEEWEAAPYILLANQFVCVAWFARQPQYARLLEINREMTLWLVENFSRLRVSD